MKFILTLSLIIMGVVAYLFWPKPNASFLRAQEIEEAIPIPQIMLTLLEPNIEEIIPIPQITITLLAEEMIPIPQTILTLLEPIPIAETETPWAETDSSTQSTTEASCSSPDAIGLSIAFERELGIFLNNAAATYGAQYSNLQYTIGNQQITQNQNQGTVSANYQGSVSEIATGQTISASGGMSVNFSWDGCYWQLVDYSYY
jgi:hypothetical protein